jgi:hypothetical protein
MTHIMLITRSKRGQLSQIKAILQQVDSRF